jgi:hypothetical protein
VAGRRVVEGMAGLFSGNQSIPQESSLQVVTWCRIPKALKGVEVFIDLRSQSRSERWCPYERLATEGS